ncbi:FHA domain-containing protein [Breznakiella homolactica]|uniref:YscD cytoplasmic domain-containing protein n=1 Tax=Breznakiella homolactica TaxID=2798577 RepID=A0A7T8BCH5_9SPIR|nr:FHA domain-containing protein [Breznakiella homolactica]QQO10263.1 FHA domain-containing protein [Breznakiella homolactica]
MTAFIKKILLCLLGLSGALCAWASLEIMLFWGDSAGGYFLLSLIEGIIIGLFFGFVFGSADGILLSDKRRALEGGLSGLCIGALAGAAVTVLVQGLLTALFNMELFSRKTEASLVLPLIRAAGWCILGAAIGSIDGLRSRSPRRAGIGISGGALGGLLGGLLLELAGRFLSNGFAARGIGILVMGTCIGLFYSIFEAQRSFGILKVLTGTIRGKEYLLASAKTILGSSRRSAMDLRGYKGIEDEHLLLRAEKNGVLAESLRGKVTINEKPAEKKTLRYEDVIELGSLKLLFLPVR